LWDFHKIISEVTLIGAFGEVVMDENAERMAFYYAYKLKINETGNGATFVPFLKMGYVNDSSGQNITKVT